MLSRLRREILFVTACAHRTTNNPGFDTRNFIIEYTSEDDPGIPLNLKLWFKVVYSQKIL